MFGPTFYPQVLEATTWPYVFQSAAILKEHFVQFLIKTMKLPRVKPFTSLSNRKINDLQNTSQYGFLLLNSIYEN